MMPMTDERETNLPDFEAKNPRYAGKKGSDMVRALLRPKDPKVREALKRVGKVPGKKTPREGRGRRIMTHRECHEQ